MIDPNTPKALRAISSMMRMEGYRTDATGVEALVLDNAADEIELLGECFVEANESEVWFRNLLAEVKEENERLRAALQFIASPDGSCYNCASIALAALEGK